MEMKTKHKTLVLLITLLSLTILTSNLWAKETLRYSSSAQVYSAFGEEVLKAFTKDSGVEVDLYICSSNAAVGRMMNGFADIASSVKRISHTDIDYGYYEIIFARAPMVVITNASSTVNDMTGNDLRGIFSGSINNWKDVGGPDEKISIVIPSDNTGAFKNFSLLALKRFDVKYDFMTFRSTSVVELVKYVPWSISFISRGAHTQDKAIKTISIDGVKPDDSNYPFYQNFSFITKGEPKGASKKLIDFFLSEKVINYFENSGIQKIKE